MSIIKSLFSYFKQTKILVSFSADKDNKESSIGEDEDIKTAKPFQLTSHMIHGEFMVGDRCRM